MTRCHRPFRQLETLGSGPFLLASGDIGNVANDYAWGLASESLEWGFPQESILVAPTCLVVWCRTWFRELCHCGGTGYLSNPEAKKLRKLRILNALYIGTRYSQTGAYDQKRNFDAQQACVDFVTEK